MQMTNREEKNRCSVEVLADFPLYLAHFVFCCHLVLLCSGVHIEVATQTQPQDHTAASSDLHSQCK
jgi:hypothetical protein